MLIGLLALTVAALFAGAAVYVSVAEHPARMMLDDKAALTQFKPAYARGAIMQASLAAIGTLLGLVAWLNGGHWLWIAGAGLLGANIPYTLVVIMPVNTALNATDPAAAGAASRALLTRWGELHAGRSALGALATLLYLLALLR
jgi:hypothetical protein